MQRRDVIRLLGAAGIPALAGLSPSELLALGRDTAHGVTTARRHPRFDDHQHATIDQISELILPATDTPGARAAGVVGFIEVIVAEWYHEDERAAFQRGLADVDSRSQADFGRTFLELTEPQQAAILTGMDAEARAMPPGSPTPFFSRIKGLTLSGYYTSEIGITQELGDGFMPGRYDGAAPVRAAAAALGGR
jgi:hypothetical protein